MSTATALPPEVEAYLAAVREELQDLAPAERDDLLTEVEDSLLESAAESGGSLTARLGHPADFAAELRSAAGLAAVGDRRASGPGSVDRLLALRRRARGAYPAGLSRDSPPSGKTAATRVALMRGA